jgi:ribokinase
MHRVCVVGSFMMDLLIRAPHRPQPGETVIGTSFQRILGGKGYNQALAAARAGATTTMIGRLGDDEYGREFLAGLDSEGVGSTGVVVDPVHGTGVGAPVVEDSGENSIVVVPRANGALTDSDIDASADLIAEADILLLQLELPPSTAVAAARVARRAGTRVLLNPAPAGGLHTELRGLVDVLVPNEHEARTLLGGGALDCVRLAHHWACDVVVTTGGAGCVVADGDAPLTIPSFLVESIDTVGAGDAFCGALAAWLAAGAELAEALPYANAAGAIAVTRPGAGPSMPRRDEIVALAERRQLMEVTDG